MKVKNSKKEMENLGTTRNKEYKDSSSQATGIVVQEDVEETGISRGK